MYSSTMTVNTDIITTTCGRELDLSRTELIIERSNSLFSYNIHKLNSGEYVIAEKFFANLLTTATSCSMTSRSRC
ncbi:hypothetical protein [Pontibacter sp. BAB1700]|uniref:hypothetical protein n=1 Tax=Pontibacter sp. BAB1700 TaxID=1144253 RepID=UPI0012DCFA01|nr:hypothetical protein [Pontibacter sp. BAB1700]